MEKISLTNINHGYAVAMFDSELEKVLANIQDDRTDATAKRKIVLSITFTPDEDRKIGVTTIGCNSKLAPVTPKKNGVYFGTDENGKLAAFPNNPKQKELDLDIQ